MGCNDSFSQGICFCGRSIYNSSPKLGEVAFRPEEYVKMRAFFMTHSLPLRGLPLA